MGLLEKVDASRHRKSWGGQPTIWEQDALRYAFLGVSQTWAETETIDRDFVSYFLECIAENPIIYGAFDRRRQVFSQANVMWQTMQGGRGGQLASSSELDLLRTPWPKGTLSSLFSRMEGDATAAGNFYATLVDDNFKIGNAARGSRTARISRLRPDWVTIVIGVPNRPGVDSNDPRARVLMYEYRTPKSTEPLQLLPEEVVHYAPVPDLISRWRGMSWLTPVLLEIMADKAITRHKQGFFKHGGVHSMALKYPPNTDVELLREYKKLYDEEYRGVDNHFKVFHIAGADPVPVTADLQQLDLKHVQGAGETRIALAAGIPAAILGISEGLEGSTLNAGNFGAARRLFVDTTIRDLWGTAVPALQTLVKPPQSNQRLWYEDTQIPFLREDAADNAKIKTQDATTIKMLVDSGCDWDAAVEYVSTGDFSKLKGKQVETPVQVQATANKPPADAPTDPQNGNRRNGNQQVEAAPRR